MQQAIESMATVPAAPVSVLFVCLGNICRSTMAEGVFRSIASKPPYDNLIKTVDSAGTASYHTGASPDSRTVSTLEAYGIADYAHEARRVRLTDFEDFEYIFAMDRSNLHDLQRLKQRRPTGKAEIMLFGEYSGGKVEIVEDPYYGGKEGFEIAYEQCLRFSKNFIKAVFPNVDREGSML